MGGAPFQAKSEVSIVKVFPAFIQSFPKTVMARSHAVDRTHCHNTMLWLRLSLESLYVSPELTLYILVEMHASYDK